MVVTAERLAEILENERVMSLREWDRYFDNDMTEEEREAYIQADSGQPRG